MPISAFLFYAYDLVTILDLQPTEYWQFPDTETTYEGDGYFLEWIDDIFSMKNTGREDILLFGIRIGDKYEMAESILNNDGWVLYYQNGKNYTYGAIINEILYFLDVETENNKITYWYINNWPEGDGVSEFFDTIRDEGKHDKENNFLQSWQQMYIDYIQNNPTGEWGQYQMIFINDDDIPELVVNHGSVAGGGEVFTFSNVELNSVHVYDYGVSYIEQGNLFCDSGGRMDSYYDIIYSIENGQIIKLYEGDYGAIDNSDVLLDSDGEPIYEYYWNDIAVSETEYQQSLNSVYDQSISIHPYENTYDYHSIIEQIQGF